MKLSSRIVIAVWILLLLLSGWWISSHSKIATDLSSFLPKSVNRNQQLLLSQLESGATSRLILIGIEGDNPQALADLSKNMARQLKSNSMFSYVNNGEQAFSQIEQQLLLKYRYLLSPAINQERFSAASLSKSLQNDLEMLASPVGIFFKSILPRDPTAEWFEILAGLNAVKTPATRYGVWFSADNKKALVIAETAAPGFDVDAQQQAVNFIQQTFSRIASQDTQLLLTGVGVFAVESRASIERDAWLMSVIAITLVVLLLLVVYRSVRLVVLSALPVLSGLLVGLAAISLGFGVIHGITLGFGAILIGEAVDYPTYLFTQITDKDGMSGTLERIWPTLRLAILSTLLSGSAMLLTDFTGLSQLGVLLVTGIIVAGLVTRWILPTLSPQQLAVPIYFPVLTHWPKFIQSKPWMAKLLWLIFILASVLLAYRYADLWDDDLANMSPVPESAKLLDKQMRSEMGASDIRYFYVVTGKDQETVLQRSEEMTPQLKQLIEQKAIAGFDMAARYLPSHKTQLQRKQTLPDEATLKPALAQALKGMPFRADVFSPFIKEISETKHGKLLELSDFGSSGLGLKVKSLLFHNQDAWFALIPLYDVNEKTIAAEIGNINIPDAFFLDLKTEADQLIGGYRKQVVWITILSLSVIMLALLFGLKRPVKVIRVMLPVVMAVVLVCVSLLLMGYRLSLFHLISLLLVVGIGINYALFFNLHTPNREYRQRAALSLTLCSLTTLIAFSSLIISTTPVLRAMGITVSLGVIFSLITSAILAERSAAGE